MNGFEKFVNQCCEDKDILACKTSEEVREEIYGCVYPAYKGKASDGKINAVIDDITESVCLRLNIPQV